MDVAYNQHASHVRRKNRSSTNLNRLSLAPLTSKLPMGDADDVFPDSLPAPSHVHSMSYLQGKSAPTTPRLLSRSPASGRSPTHSRRGSTPASAAVALPKSKSATHLHGRKTPSGSGAASPSLHRRSHHPHHGHQHVSAAGDHNETDWLLRAGALISSETRESKGQAWLVSRASSTSLTGLRGDADEHALERELARERDLAAASSRHESRRGSVVLFVDDEVVMSPPGGGSRLGSRSQSRAGSRGNLLLTPAAEQQRRSVDGYFPQQQDDAYAGPDFVNLDEKLEAIEQNTLVEDEAHVRRLVKRGNAAGGVGTWFGSVLGWGLFSVEEHEEESDDGDGTEEGETEESPTTPGGRRRSSAGLRFAGTITPTVDEPILPPPKGDEGGWQDAAWLLSVASKVLL